MFKVFFIGIVAKKNFKVRCRRGNEVTLAGVPPKHLQT